MLMLMMIYGFVLIVLVICFHLIIFLMMMSFDTHLNIFIIILLNITGCLV